MVVIFPAAAAATGEGLDPREDPVVLTQQRLDRVLLLTKGWSYHPGDDPAWADPALDDASWAVVRPCLQTSDEIPGGWPGIGWFRRRVMIDPAVQTTNIGVHFYQAGASELYVDGVLAVRFGTVSADPKVERAVSPQVLDSIALSPGKVHVLAVRFSNSTGNVLSGGFRGFDARVGGVHEMVTWGVGFVRIYTGLMAGAIGMFGAFVLLHLLLFLSRPSLRENLGFVAFGASLVTVLGAELWMNSQIDLSVYRVAFNLEMSAMFALVVTAMLLERRIFDQPLDIAFWVIAGAGAVTLGWLWSQPALTDRPVVAGFLVLGLADMLRLAVGALRRRERDAWVVAAGFAALTLSFFGALLRNLGVIEISPWPMFIGGFGALALSFSVYLTRRVAHTDRQLERRLVEVQDLTSRALEQERAAREQEITRRVLEADNLRKTAELEEARRMLLAMLPLALPVLPGFEIAVHMTTASEVGGDYYDFLRGADDDWTIAVGDATGHGLHAGMVVGLAKGILQSANGAGGLGRMLNRIHTGLVSLNERRASMTLVLVRLNGSTLRIASAGMPPVLIRRHGSGSVEEILLPGVPLGTLQRATWREHEVSVGEGDSILLMSDGLAEMPDAEGEPFGYDRVQREFARAGALEPAEALERLVGSADRHRGGESIRDDVTLLMLRVRSPRPLTH